MRSIPNFIFIICVLVFIFRLISCIAPQNKLQSELPATLWYNKPAATWIDALPLGNGRLGVMIFGDPVNERIQLNDDSLWPADVGWEESDGTPEDLKRIRQLLFEGKNSEADALFVDKFSNKSIVRSHQTMGDLWVDLQHDSISDYRRELDISTATSTVSYKTNGHPVTYKSFVSHPDQVIAIEIASDGPTGLNGRLRFSRPEDDGYSTVQVTTNENHQLVMQGEVTQRKGVFESTPTPILSGVEFEAILSIGNEGGSVSRGTGHLELVNVKKAVVLIVSNSSFYHENYQEQNQRDLEQLNGKSFAHLLKRHIRDYQSLYSRVQLKLTDELLDSLPTDLRLQRIKKGQTDLGLESLLFQYGRYLLISSSREGTNPAHLQGLWNQHIEAPWNADYHLNINLQMNYWPADPTNLGELNHPLFDYVDRLVENGKTVAKNNFGCRGSFIPHATDLWAPAWLRAPTAFWGCSVGAGGWLMQHYWHHFEFTEDTTFLKERVYPVLTEVAQFYSDWLIEDPRDGTLISAPSTSPENRFINERGDTVATCLGSAMDQQVITEVFDHYVRMCEILENQTELFTRIQQQQLKLRKGFVIGSDGRILEWDREYEEPEPGHRHISHVYGFHPGTSITKDGTPEIFEAVKKTLDYRLGNGGAGTGWSRAWLINFCARLLEAEKAYEHIQLLFQRSMAPNLFDLHPPFQIDGNFGYTAGIAEMLLQSHEPNTLRLLPALPGAWQNGHITGLKARGNMEVDLYWEGGQLQKVILLPQTDGNKKLIYGDKEIEIQYNASQEIQLDGELLND